MKKNVFTIICECGVPVKGFSQLHADSNHLIHRETSYKHKERMELIKNGVPNCEIPCSICKREGKTSILRSFPTGGKWEPIELKCPKCDYIGGRIHQRSSINVP